jgi:hypothetical protein
MKALDFAIRYATEQLAGVVMTQNPLWSMMASYSWNAPWQNLTWWDERFPNFGTDE